jgi:hypothetical protein
VSLANLYNYKEYCFTKAGQNPPRVVVPIEEEEEEEEEEDEEDEEEEE